jgi:hypothetical protein
MRARLVLPLESNESRRPCVPPRDHPEAHELGDHSGGLLDARSGQTGDCANGEFRLDSRQHAKDPAADAGYDCLDRLHVIHVSRLVE